MSVTVYTDHGIFKYPESDYFEVDTDDGVLEVKKGEETIALFNTGQWFHAEFAVEDEEEEEQPETVDFLTHELLARADWFDRDGDKLTLRGGQIRRHYDETDSHSSSERSWVENALTEYGPYRKVVA